MVSFILYDDEARPGRRPGGQSYAPGPLAVRGSLYPPAKRLQSAGVLMFGTPFAHRIAADLGRAFWCVGITEA